MLDLLSTLRAGSAMPVGALVEAGALFAISENNVRVTVARLLASGHVARDERGAYRLGGASRSIGAHVRTWRDRDRRTRKWSGGWLAVHAGPAARAAQRGRARALRLLGFATLRPGLWLRPDNLALPLDDVRRELAALGLPPGDLVCVLADLDAASDARARRLWDVATLRRTYRELGATLTASETRLERLPPEKAMAESFILGGRALRQLVLDPLLPDAICPPDERDALLEQMRRYDRLGRLA
ncbi:MAG: PaaX family transcriptional regulator C-terminal domain-containing protein, partial [Candidatus Binatia bacterium]